MGDHRRGAILLSRRGREYVSDLYMGSGFLRYGLTDDITADVDLQSDNYFTMAGVGGVTQTGWGLIGLRGAGSYGETGAGMAASLDWSAVNFQGLTGSRGETARIFAEYLEPELSHPGDISTAATGIIYPEWNYWLNLNALFCANRNGKRRPRFRPATSLSTTSSSATQSMHMVIATAPI